MNQASVPNPESIKTAQELAEWHFTATAPGAQVERPEVIQDAMDEMRQKYPGIIAVEATNPTIPDEAAAPIRRKLTIAEMNANERRHIAQTRRMYPKNRRGR